MKRNTDEDLNDKQREALDMLEPYQGFSSDYLDFDMNYQAVYKKAMKLWAEGLKEKTDSED